MERSQVLSAEEEERERKREAIRKRIAQAKIEEKIHKEMEKLQLEKSEESARSLGHANDDAGRGSASRAPEEEVRVQERDHSHEQSYRTSYNRLPLPTHEAGAEEGITYKTFSKEEEMAEIVALIDKDLSEPYSIFTYRYFIYNWPHHAHMAMYNGKCCGVVVCKLEQHRDYYRGYIAMLAVDSDLRGKGIGTCLVGKAIRSMRAEGCEEVVLETECSNTGALRLYENLGFFRDKRLLRYYLNGGDAFRLKLWFPGVAYYA